jgi:nucleoside 2-deoxyribosyltransferase
VFIAEKVNQAGENLWSKIRKGIDESDCVLVLWSKGGSESGDVREEIGYAFGKEKRVIPMSETELKGSIKGSEFFKVDRSDLKTTIADMTTKKHSLAKGKAETAPAQSETPASS